MKKIIDHQIIEGSLSDIREEVKTLIESNKGWEPQGSLIRFTDRDNRPWFIREMVQVKYMVPGMQDRS